MTALSYIAMVFGAGLGVAFHIMAKIKILRTKFPKESPRNVLIIFFNEEWDVLFGSFLVNSASIFAAYLGAANYFKVKPEWRDLALFVIMILVGYAGQRLIYKYLGTAEQVLSDRAKYHDENQQP